MTNTTEEPRRRYLRRVFQFNPLWQAPQLLELRRKALGLSSQDTAPGKVANDLQARRAAIRQQIGRLQQEFWNLPLQQLRAQLNAIDTRELPELSPVLNRLRTTASCRGEFPRLAAIPGMDLPLFRAFKTAVVLPPAEAGFTRERFLQSIQDRARLKQVKQAVQLIQQHCPLLYALEKDWFSTILKMKKPAAARRAAGEVSFQFPEFSLGTWIVVFVVIRVLVGILRG